jgi:hypothetical protein
MGWITEDAIGNETTKLPTHQIKCTLTTCSGVLAMAPCDTFLLRGRIHWHTIWPDLSAFEPWYHSAVTYITLCCLCIQDSRVQKRLSSPEKPVSETPTQALLHMGELLSGYHRWSALRKHS